jgi:hypothetical protein
LNRLTFQRVSRQLVLVTALFMVSTAGLCTDAKLKDLVAEADKVADTALIIQQAALDGEAAGALNRNQTRAIMLITKQVLTANNHAMDIAEDLSKLDEPSREQLMAVLAPVIKGVDAALKDPVIVGIENVPTRTSIIGSLTTIQTTLNSIQLIIAASK